MTYSVMRSEFCVSELYEIDQRGTSSGIDKISLKFPNIFDFEIEL